MAKPPWNPWHEVVRLRDDVRTGELSLSTFAADLYGVARMEGKRPVYEDPAEFFALTYPTTNLRDLARDVAGRLAGKNTKAIRQLELTYGGGKTHTLITLFHLAANPAALPQLPAVAEFRHHIGLDPLPQARIAVLPFDKIDVEKGIEIAAPDGALRWLRQPWSALAWQIAGPEGLSHLHADGVPEERESPPAENLLVDLLAIPGRDGLGTLVLIDEVLMYAREKVSQGAEWRGRLQSFFQYLCQATVKVDRAAMVASLLATDPAKYDDAGRGVLRDILDVFAREREEGVQPVTKDDVAEVLRRRFFTPASLAASEGFKQHVIAALQGIQELDADFKKRAKAEEARFLASYPFHPDLTEVLYTKWTQLKDFQRTRGVLRIFAIALRDAEAWDESPLVGTNVLLPKPGQVPIAEACRELAGVAAQEKDEGAGHNWTAILEGELAKAREAQEQQPGLRHRELEQAVLATFVHSLPLGQKAALGELQHLVGATRPDKIGLEKGLAGWLETSWFLDDAADPERKAGGGLPKVWRLGTQPNLRQMHDVACQRVLDADIDNRLEQEIRAARSLTAQASGAGAVVHLLPAKPADVADDGELHYAVLGPSAASESGKPSPEARKFLEENTGPQNPRKERNAVILAVPSRDGLQNAEAAVRKVLGWELVRQDLKDHDLDPLRTARLEADARDAQAKMRAAVAQAYAIVVTVGKEGEIQAFKVSPSEQSLFATIAADSRARLQSGAINAEALLPGGPYTLWKEGETSRWAADLAGAFARFPHLPKMLRREAILDTLAGSIREGLLVGRLVRPDKSFRTFWHEEAERALLAEKGFELVLPAHAELASLDPALVAPGGLPGLWASDEIAYPDLLRLFDGSGSLAVDRGGYTENLAVPKAAPEVVARAVAEAVQSGRLWLVAGPVSVFREPLPAGILGAQAVLRRPPEPLGPFDLLPDQLPGAWSDGKSNPKALHLALAAKRGQPVPWATLSEGISYVLKKGLIAVATGSPDWPCPEESAGQVILSHGEVIQPPRPVGIFTAAGSVQSHELQDLADVIGKLVQKAGPAGLQVGVHLEVGGAEPASKELIADLNKILEEAGLGLRFG